MDLTKTQYHELRRQHYSMEKCADLLLELPDVNPHLAHALRLLSKDVWKILMECEVVND